MKLWLQPSPNMLRMAHQVKGNVIQNDSTSLCRLVMKSLSEQTFLEKSSMKNREEGDQTPLWNR